ncbi:BC1872 family protein [Calidifontibacillus erzurumensis]|uniref:Phage ABA sandwich domain-containing protein n=1 Tax=Calidifontibacillus erzurumensis TaxID=2741433 RepID=A0A8J8GBU9_9BACI|nr:hypothetical protein [Calidifontibacillus erzurumensis]NSL50944.1 hypothetical protein [Calidifontibacillus erzurumensis]
MNKIDIIARRILGWKLNRWDRWYDHEKGVFIHESEFQPEENLEHAMIIVEKLKQFGFTFTKKSNTEVCFDHICASGNTLSQAITNAAFEIADNRSIDPGWL